jgi:hypothetical protein
VPLFWFKWHSTGLVPDTILCLAEEFQNGLVFVGGFVIPDVIGQYRLLCCLAPTANPVWKGLFPITSSRGGNMKPKTTKEVDHRTDRTIDL